MSSGMKLIIDERFKHKKQIKYSISQLFSSFTSESNFRHNFTKYFVTSYENLSQILSLENSIVKVCR